MLSVPVAIAVGYDLGADRFAGYTELFVRIAGVVLLLSGVGQLYVAGLQLVEATRSGTTPP